MNLSNVSFATLNVTVVVIFIMVHYGCYWGFFVVCL